MCHIKYFYIKLYGEEFGLMASLEESQNSDDYSLTTKVDSKKSIQSSSCQSSPNKRKDSLGKIEKYLIFLF